MKNNLEALNNYLFEEMERLLDDSMSEEAQELEFKRAGAVTNVAGTILKTGELELKALSTAHELGIGIGKKEDLKMPRLLESGSES